MSGQPCGRKWQVEAARDGRLLGKDLQSALRHRETCTECASEELELSALGRQLAHLPEIARDEVSVQRSRQHLMAAHNESVIDPPRRGSSARAAGASAFALAAAAAGWFVAIHRQPASDAARVSREIVEVHAQVGARWAKHEEASRILLDFEDGVAAFEVHPHPGRSVIIRLPDGEVEDMGTVFDVRVAEQHTKHVAVSEGRVSIRFNGRPSVSLKAGETWDLQPASLPRSAAARDAGPAAPASAPQPATARPGGAVHSRMDKPSPLTPSNVLLKAPAASASSAQDSRPAPSARSMKAEDDAYLHVVDLLRAGKDADARAQAKEYLLRFPSGFRRIEVLNIATRGARDGAADDTKMRDKPLKPFGFPGNFSGR